MDYCNLEPEKSASLLFGARKYWFTAIWSKKKLINSFLEHENIVSQLFRAQKSGSLQFGARKKGLQLFGP